jgi:hypothetical protein
MVVSTEKSKKKKKKINYLFNVLDADSALMKLLKLQTVVKISCLVSFLSFGYGMV